MVHPYLTTDPIQRQGEIGKVVEVDKNDEDVLIVDFSDGKKGAYFSDALLTLYPTPIILQGLISNNDILLPKEREAILSIHKLVVKGKYDEAMKLANETSGTSFICMTTCDRWIELKKEQSMKKHRSKKI